jgi:hypothetical protein
MFLSILSIFSSKTIGIMKEYIHVGGMIENLLDDAHRTKRDLGLDIGMSQSNIVYLTKRPSIDVQTLHKIGVNLKYNFWKHYPIDDGTGGQTLDGRVKLMQDEKNKVIAELNAKLTEKDKEIEALKQEMVRQENVLLKEINGLLKKK